MRLLNARWEIAEHFVESLLPHAETTERLFWTSSKFDGDHGDHCVHRNIIEKSWKIVEIIECSLKDRWDICQILWSLNGFSTVSPMCMERGYTTWSLRKADFQWMLNDLSTSAQRSHQSFNDLSASCQQTHNFCELSFSDLRWSQLVFSPKGCWVLTQKGNRSSKYRRKKTVTAKHHKRNHCQNPGHYLTN